MFKVWQLVLDEINLEMILPKVFDENNVQEFFPLQLFIALDLI